MTIWKFLLHVTGSDNVSGKFYGFWSGFAGDLTIFGGMGMLYRKHVCHEPWCFRLGKHPDGLFMKCPRHHPEIP